MGTDALRLGAPTPNITNLGIQSYPSAVGVTAGAALTLCVEPGRTFSVAFYYQGATEALAPAPSPQLPVEAMQWVTRNGSIFTSAAVVSPQKPDLDWNWPWIAFQIPAGWPSGVYFAITYPVDAVTGLASDALGQAVQAGDPNGKLKPHPDFAAAPIQAWDHGMALFVVRTNPASPPANPAKIAYALAASTYQAYNNTGTGCFYYSSAITRVTLRRPGGGVGSMIMDDEIDSFDTSSRRNTYAHWDAYFIRWLAAQQIACDFYTNYDVDDYTGSRPSPLMNGTTPAYKLLLCVGHDEYWSAAIRANIEAFQQAGGNIAIFSGNTCYRPVGFGAPSTSASRYDPPPSSIPADDKSTMIRLNDWWPDELNEASTIGVTFKKGAGSWGSNVRSNSGYTSVVPIVGSMGSFGVAASLVGYECDGLFSGHSPVNYVVLATAHLTDASQWSEIHGDPAMGYFQRNTQASQMTSLLFNAATTDWARFLPLGATSDPDKLLVGAMTLSTIHALGG